MIALAILLGLTATYPPRVLATHLAPSLVYQHGLFFGSWPLVNYVAWSLEVEIQFYVLAPVFAAVFGLPTVARRVVLAAVIAAGSGVDGFLAPEGVTRWWLSLPAHLHYFAIGFLLADLRATKWRSGAEPSRGWDLAGALAWGSLIPLRGQPMAYALVFPAVAGIATAATLRGRMLGAIARFPLFTTIGGMCYTIYLWHTTIVENAAPFTLGMTIFTTPWLERLTHVALLAALSVLAAIPLYLLFEKPFMFRDWPERAARRPLSVWLRPGVFGREAGR
jgi:peptidoglycan/LPS O-acetylase OafA/YrhL